MHYNATILLLFFRCTVMCPKGDDPVTSFQHYRTMSLEVNTLTPSYTYPSGLLGLEFMGKKAYIDLARPDNCTNDLSYAGPFGEIDCSYIRTGDAGSILTFQLIFKSWPSYITDNNIFFHDGNPSRYDFHCDITKVRFRNTLCIFSDIYASDVIGGTIISI